MPIDTELVIAVPSGAFMLTAATASRMRRATTSPAAMSVSVILLAAACLLTGVFFSPILSSVIEPAVLVLTGGK